MEVVFNNCFIRNKQNRWKSSIWYAPATGVNNQISTPVAYLIKSSGQVQIQTNTDSSSVSTGSLIVSGGVGISKKLYVGDSLYLPTSGGTSSALNYYEEGTSTLTLSGLWASNPTVIASWCRIGSIVFIQTQSASVSSTNASGSSFSITGFPSRLYPSRVAYFYFPLIATQGGTTINTVGNINNSGTMSVSGTFTSSTVCGLPSSFFMDCNLKDSYLIK